MADPLSIQDVRHVARLARLELSDEALESHRQHLGAILAYFDRLRHLDLEDVRPLAHPAIRTNRWDEDTPGPALDTEALMRMAPETHPPFIRVPRVLGDEGSSA
ncbi:MAG: Asp-tRNA(Asn)/Glu-tRNA(Gln) amidotransferase subunit GatC [Phycisphaerales bacterium]|nr:Asp-tRNA(Asn)/Glu-tRNA(Gln) amidotransferase subunit GatC [Phycisphaerales bacterium]